MIFFIKSRHRGIAGKCWNEEVIHERLILILGTLIKEAEQNYQVLVL